MRTVEYTEAYWPDSTWVDGVYFNANTNEAVVDLDDEIYLYKGISEKMVEELAEADSPGGHYNKVWKQIGATEHLGSWEEIVFNEVPVKKQEPVAPVQNDFTATTVNNHFTVAGDVSAGPLSWEPSHRGAQVEDTLEFSLRTPTVSDDSDDDTGNVFYSWQVVFSVDEDEDEKVHVVTAPSLVAAAQEMEKLGALLHIHFDVLEVARIG